MKKLLFGALLLMTSSVVKAQLFNHEYGTNRNERAYDGIATFTGHAITGTQVLTGTGINDLVLVSTNPAGVQAGPFSFDNTYRLTSVNGEDYQILNSKVGQISDGNYMVAAAFQNLIGNPARRGIITAVIAPTGVVISVSAFNQINNQFTSVNVERVFSSADGTAMYVCGDMINPGVNFSARSFIVALSNTNNLIWERQYVGATSTSVLDATDLIESPFSNSLVLLMNVVISNRYRVQVLNINPLNGNVTSGFTYNLSGTSDIYGVSIVADTDPDNEGFVICGHESQTTNSTKLFVFRLNTSFALSGTVLSLSNPLGATGTYFAVDIERTTDASGTSSFVVLGNITPGLMGGVNLAVVRLNGALQPDPITNIYGPSGIVSDCEALSLQGGGVSIYGTTYQGLQNSNLNFFVLRDDFNGGIPCNFDQAPTSSGSLSFFRSTASVLTGTPFSVINLELVLFDDLNFFFGCSDMGRLANPAPVNQLSDKTYASIYPNPVSASSLLVNVMMNAEVAGQIDFSVTDLLGREVLNTSVQVAEGVLQQTLQLPSGTAPGVYYVRVSAGSNIETHRILVE